MNRRELQFMILTPKTQVFLVLVPGSYKTQTTPERETIIKDRRRVSRFPRLFEGAR